MKKLILIVIVVVAFSTAAYALICTDCKTCPTPCSNIQPLAGCGSADAPKCDPNSKPAPKCGGDVGKCDPNSKPAPKCAGCTDPNKPKCGAK
jgi:hypothetical protein